MHNAFTLAWLQAFSAAPSHCQANFGTLTTAPGLPRGVQGSFISHDDILAFDASACLVFEWSEIFSRKATSSCSRLTGMRRKEEYLSLRFNTAKQEVSWGCTISSGETVESMFGQKKRISASCCEEAEAQMSPV